MGETYRVLVSGNAHLLIERLFAMSDIGLEFMSTSDRLKDIKSHLNYFGPDVFLYCPENENIDNMMRIFSAKSALDKAGTRIAVAASMKDISEFEKACGNIEEAAITDTKDMDALIKSISDLAQGCYQGMSAGMPNLDAVSPEVSEQEVHDWRNQFEADLDGGFEESYIDDEPLTDAAEVERVLAEMANQIQLKHVLVVDDDPIMLRSIQGTLDGMFNVGTAVNGKVALKFLEKKHTDLILLDYEMPGMTGEQVFKVIKNNPSTANIPVIFLTGVSDAGRIKDVLALGPKGYLLKPVDKDKLVAAVRQVIG